MADNWASVASKHSIRVQIVVLTVLVMLATMMILITITFAMQYPDRSIDAVFGLFRISAKSNPSVEACKAVLETKGREVDLMASQIAALIQAERDSATKVAELRVKFLNENIVTPTPGFWSADQKYSYALRDQQSDYDMHIQGRKRAQDQQKALIEDVYGLNKVCGIPIEPEPLVRHYDK